MIKTRDVFGALMLVAIGTAIGTLIALGVAYYLSKDAIDQKLSASPLGKLLGG